MSMTTAEALELLREGRAERVGLLRPGLFMAMVSFDVSKQEYLIKGIDLHQSDRHQPKERSPSLQELLVTTKPCYILYSQPSTE